MHWNGIGVVRVDTINLLTSDASPKVIPVRYWG